MGGSIGFQSLGGGSGGVEAIAAEVMKRERERERERESVSFRTP
jgi:hypothetical protein